MTSPAGGFLEGLLSGGQAGYGFRQDITDTRRRRTMEDERLKMLQQGARIQQNQENRAETEFQTQQADADRVRRLRNEVATRLQAPKHYRTVGEFLSGGQGTPMAPELSPDAVMARDVGREIGKLAGFEPTDDEALLLGTGQVPGNLFGLPSERDRWSLAYGYRYRPGAGTAAKPAISLNDALKQVTGFFWDADLGQYKFPAWATPARRLELAKKLQDGSLSNADFPVEQAPVEEPKQPSAWSRFWHGLFGGGDAHAAPEDGGTMAPDAGAAGLPTRRGSAGAPERPAPPEGPAGPDLDRSARIESARVLIRGYGDLAPAELQDILTQAGYSDDEISEILGGSP